MIGRCGQREASAGLCCEILEFLSLFFRRRPPLPRVAGLQHNSNTSNSSSRSCLRVRKHRVHVLLQKRRNIIFTNSTLNICNSWVFQPHKLKKMAKFCLSKYFSTKVPIHRVHSKRLCFFGTRNISPELSNTMKLNYPQKNRVKGFKHAKGTRSRKKYVSTIGNCAKKPKKILKVCISVLLLKSSVNSISMHY